MASAPEESSPEELAALMAEGSAVMNGTGDRLNKAHKNWDYKPAAISSATAVRTLKILRNDMPEAHSWEPVDLLDAGANPPAAPTVAGLLYADRSHLISGETEAVKTWLALIFCAEVMATGKRVVYIDYENGPAEILARLRHLGVTDEAVREYFTYFHPDEGIVHEPGRMRDLLTVIDGAALAAVDSWIGALQTHGLDPKSDVDIERWRRTFLVPVRSACPAPLILDHVVKAEDARGRYATGSERKTSAVEVHLGAEIITQFSRGRTGRVKLSTHKDRGGHLPRPRAAELELRSDPETLAVTWTFHRQETPAEGETFRPTYLMERVSRYLEEQASPTSRTQLAQAVSGKRMGVFGAINSLVAEGFAGETGAGGIYSERPFRDAENA